jgi:capsule biosynthesis phosphatase
LAEERKRIVIDLDGTLCLEKAPGQSYADVAPNEAVVEKLREYRRAGFYVIVSTSRQMRTYEGNVGRINAHTLPVILDWLARHEVPFDEVHVGKPWCGFEGFYVDDKAVRPAEFAALSYDELRRLTGSGRGGGA